MKVTYNMAIMHFVRQTILALCAFGFAFTANAEPRALDNYKSIIDRNPFGLKDPPPPPPPKEAANTNQTKKEEFYLTGISTIGNPKRPKAYLLARDNSKKDYDQKYYNLTVGDRQGDVLLREIDEKGRRVRIVYQGEDKWLSMKDDGVPAPAGPAPGTIPGIPGQPGAVPPPPGAVPLPLPGGASPAHSPQPLSYPNAANRRTVRTSMPTLPTFSSGAGASYGALASPQPVYGGTAPNFNGAATVPQPQNAAPTGPQTEADVLKQIINVQNPQLPPGIPKPPVPSF